MMKLVNQTNYCWLKLLFATCGGKWFKEPREFYCILPNTFPMIPPQSAQQLYRSNLYNSNIYQGHNTAWKKLFRNAVWLKSGLKMHTSLLCCLTADKESAARHRAAERRALDTSPRPACEPKGSMWASAVSTLHGSMAGLHLPRRRRTAHPAAWRPPAWSQTAPFKLSVDALVARRRGSDEYESAAQKKRKQYRLWLQTTCVAFILKWSLLRLPDRMRG